MKFLLSAALEVGMAVGVVVGFLELAAAALLTVAALVVVAAVIL